MINLEDTIFSQWANSPILMQIIRNINLYVDPVADLDNFYNQVWNVNTAEGYGLDVWGRIVGVNRNIKIPNPNQKYLGFAESDSVNKAAFNQAPFWNGSQATTVYALPDDLFRTLIMAKALKNISNGSCQSINQILRLLFASRGRAYVIDRMNMTMILVFEFVLDQFSLNMLVQSDVIPRPAGVGALLLNGYNPLDLFGFNGSGLNPLNHGQFFAGSLQQIVIGG